jgi:RimJ/RimL family protein N-acetyltransferase
MATEIHPLTVELIPALAAHFGRHRNESGVNDIHFMPFLPDDPQGPRGASVDCAFLPLDKCGWQRWFCAQDMSTGNIVGHVDLKSDPLQSSMHWCQLGIGIEGAYRGQGLGERLMSRAIDFARHHEQLEWIELRVFANNTPAVSLYQKLGFKTVGVLRDRFRLRGQSIDDIVMVLSIGKTV